MLDVSADQRFAKLLVERGKLRDADMSRALRVQEGQASREREQRDPLIVRQGTMLNAECSMLNEETRLNLPSLSIGH